MSSARAKSLLTQALEQKPRAGSVVLSPGQKYTEKDSKMHSASAPTTPQPDIFNSAYDADFDPECDPKIVAVGRPIPKPKPQENSYRRR